MVTVAIDVMSRNAIGPAGQDPVQAIVAQAARPELPTSPQLWQQQSSGATIVTSGSGAGLANVAVPVPPKAIRPASISASTRRITIIEQQLHRNDALYGINDT